MSSALAREFSLSTAVIRLQVVKGPDVGTSYQLIPPRVKVGRGTENDVKILDPKVSRVQAEILISTQKIVFLDKTSKGSVFVNGVSRETGAEVELKHNDVIKLGETELRVLVFFPHAGAVQKIQSQAMASAAKTNSQGTSNGNTPGAPMNPAMNSNTKRYAIYGGLALVVIIALNSGDETKPSGNRKNLRLPTTVAEEIDLKEQNVSELAKTRVFASVEEQQRHEEADRHYRTGFRDLQKGQYARALRSFETSRAIDPEHQLAIRYYAVAERKRDEEIVYGMQEGRRFREKLMYKRCAAALEKVLYAINDPKDLRYKEAEALKKECDLLLERPN